MNKELKTSFSNMKTSFCFQLAKFKQRVPGKTFVISSLICMSAEATASQDYPYQADAKSLITSVQQHSNSSNSSQDINLLRAQLLEKTKELQEYKSCLFRASHPQDLTKITELSRRIAEHEKIQQELTFKIHEYENELTDVKKQMSALEISTESLTSFIQIQHGVVEAEKEELAAKMRTYEEDTRLENEKKLNQQLLADLESLKSTIATYENRMNDLEQIRDKEVQDAMHDAAMLKFELADARLQGEKKGLEIIASNLNDITMAIDYAKMLKTRQLTDTLKLSETQNDLSTLKIVVNEVVDENLRLQRENNRLLEQGNDAQTVLDKHFAERQTLENKLSEKEENLSAALSHYQRTINDQMQQLQSLHENLSAEVASKRNLEYEKDYIMSQYEVEKHILETIREETISTLIDKHLTATQALEEHLENEISKRNRLQEEKDFLAAQFILHADSLEKSKVNGLQDVIQSLAVIAEHQDHALAEAHSAFSMIQEYNFHLEEENTHLKNRLNHLEIAEHPTKSADGNATKNKSFYVPPALLNLLKPNSK